MLFSTNPGPVDQPRNSAIASFFAAIWAFKSRSFSMQEPRLIEKGLGTDLKNSNLIYPKGLV